MPLNNEQLTMLATGLNEALKGVLYAYYKDIPVDEEMVASLCRIHTMAEQLLSRQAE